MCSEKKKKVFWSGNVRSLKQLRRVLDKKVLDLEEARFLLSCSVSD